MFASISLLPICLFSPPLQFYFLSPSPSVFHFDSLTPSLLFFFCSSLFSMELVISWLTEMIASIPKVSICLCIFFLSFPPSPGPLFHSFPPRFLHPTAPIFAKMVLATNTGLGLWISIWRYTDTSNSLLHIFSITLIAQCCSKLANTN